MVTVLRRLLPEQPAPTPLPSGRLIRHRKQQMLAWSVIAGFLGAGFIAGLYFGILQANWHVFYLKAWWDGLFSQSWWPVYRHSAFRDIPEPAFATMGVMTLLAKPKYWDRPVSNLRLVTAPVILVLVTFILGIGGTWLLHYGLPVNVRTVLAWHAAGNLILGFIIGRVLHAFWAPVGAALQGNLLDGSAERAARRSLRAHKRRIPLWVRWPLTPPVIREHFSSLFSESLESGKHGAEKKRRPVIRTVLITIMVLAAAAITALGVAGHYWAGTGHVIPWLM